MKFRAATIEDVEYFKEHSINTKADRSDIHQLDYPYTAEDDEGNLLALGGFRMIIPSCAWVWVDLSDEGVKQIKDTYRIIKSLINGWTKFHGVKRIQAFIRDDEKNKRLARHLGLEEESLMKNFYGNEDAYMYARIINESV
jgi:hypothetical protein